MTSLSDRRRSLGAHRHVEIAGPDGNTASAVSSIARSVKILAAILQLRKVKSPVDLTFICVFSQNLIYFEAASEHLFGTLNMEKLNLASHDLFTDKILKNLFQNRISTVLEFLSEDIHKLSTLTKLSLPQVIQVRCDTLAKFSAPARRGDSLGYTDTGIRSDYKFIKTGIDRLDAIIGGGIPIGHITEICGLAGAGKTQLCFALAIRVAMDSDSRVLYIDTKGDFSAVAIQNYLEKTGRSHEEMAEIMNRIQLVQVWTVYELIEFLHQLKMGQYGLSNIRMIIVDSLPCLMFQFLGDESKIGLTLLNKFVNIARFLCKEMNLATICVNVLTRWVEQAAQDIDDQDAVIESFSGKGTWVEKQHRCLGRYWQHIPGLVLQLEMRTNESKHNKNVTMNATVNKSMVGKCYLACNLYLNSVGVT